MNLFYTSSRTVLCYLWRSKPFARANIKGASEYPALKGHAEFYTVNDGVMMTWNIIGLPDKTFAEKQEIFRFHICEETNCCCGDGNCSSEVGAEYSDETGFPPYNSGLPALLSINGYSFGTSVINNFSQNDLIETTIEVSAETDNPERKCRPIKIGCGAIEKV